ncbi:probable lysophospholipase BODYGUARD 4 [Solanum lycopersicum]|uniref:AB hydrolase-1 domain-containing protein n=1 Tax=Solanum lycopersicum TaxID=4081 RepID=A0A3Q7ILC6_SOLLC|nr:probable lysophospholipase BODYGUARD 4 [Solanum lycopersicum]
MQKISVNFSEKWLQITSEILISSASAVVFLFLDLLDAIFCVFFKLIDEFFEGESSGCYCSIENEEESDCDNELSNTLHKRRNLFRGIGFRRNFSSRRKLNENVRWSDCSCENCISWMGNIAGELKLHVVVKEIQPVNLEDFKGKKAENIVFLHGFLSSSTFWTETIFPYVSEDAMQKCRLLAVDLLGFGKSPKPNNCLYTVKDHVEMIESSVIQPFELNSFHIVAHSMGCVVALALAAKHSHSVRSITLIAPPYVTSTKEDISLTALNKLAARRLWPPLLFGSSFMSWYEHLGRCVCYIICKNHRIWEGILKLLTWNRNLHFMAIDLTRHTHQSAWHTMHNVICGGAKFMDKYLETLKIAKVKINVIQGSRDQVVPVECSKNIKMKVPNAEVKIVDNADHTSIIIGREKELCNDLEKLWGSIC